MVCRPTVVERRSRISEWMFSVFGPANVKGAVKGNSPEAREA
jgi:hypothetical protein